MARRIDSTIVPVPGTREAAVVMVIFTVEK